MPGHPTCVVAKDRALHTSQAVVLAEMLDGAQTHSGVTAYVTTRPRGPAALTLSLEQRASHSHPIRTGPPCCQKALNSTHEGKEALKTETD